MKELPERRGPPSGKTLIISSAILVMFILSGSLGYILLSRSAESGVTLVYFSGAHIISLDPAAVMEQGSRAAMSSIFEPLVSYEGDGTASFKPCLATAWSVSDDGLWYNFTLRQGVSFSNGNALAADDVRFSLERAVSMFHQVGGSGGILAGLVDLDKTVVVGSHQISVRLIRPYAGLLAVLTQSSPLGVLDKEYSLEHYTAADAFGRSFLSEHPIGTGPFQMSEWEKGKELVLVRNDRYWRGWSSPHVDSVVIREGSGFESIREALSSGTADIADVPLSNASELMGVDGLAILNARTFTLEVIVMNMNQSRPSHAFMMDPRVRQAFALAFDRTNVSDAVYHGFAEELRGCIPSGFPFSAESQPSAPFRFDLRNASELLNSSGYTLDATGHRFGGAQVELMTVSGDPNGITVAGMFKRTLERLGIIVLLEDGTGEDITTYRHWDLYVTTYTPPYADPDFPVTSLAVSSAGGGDELLSGIAAPSIDLAAKRAASSLSEESRTSNYSVIWGMLRDSPNMIYVAQIDSALCVRSAVLGLVVNPVSTLDFYGCHK